MPARPVGDKCEEIMMKNDRLAVAACLDEDEPLWKTKIMTVIRGTLSELCTGISGTTKKHRCYTYNSHYCSQASLIKKQSVI